MPEADVLYSDIKFTRKEKATAAPSSTDEPTYSEVKISQPPSEPPGSQQEASNRRSKVTEQASLLLLCVLLTAAVIGLASDNFQTKNNLHTLKLEYEALRRNLSEYQTKPDQPCPTCEPGWEQHGGSCYYFSTSRLNWTQSRAECKRLGSDLVQINSRDEQKFLMLSLKEKMNDNEDKFWIGLTDSKEEGKWLWVDDSPLNNISLSFWSKREPDNWKGQNSDGEDCARMGEKEGSTDLKCWFDKTCSAAQKGLCEKPVKPGPKINSEQS